MTEKTRPRTIADDLVDAVETVTRKWTRQAKSEERHPGNVRFRAARMTAAPRTTQKEAAWEAMKEAYLAASSNDRLPAKARQIFYKARPKIMELTDDRELGYKYFSQTLLPDYIKEHGCDWKVVYDARGYLIEPHTNRRMGVGTVEIDNYLHAMDEPEVVEAGFEDAEVVTVGPAGNFSAVLTIASAITTSWHSTDSSMPRRPGRRDCCAGYTLGISAACMCARIIAAIRNLV